jgi:hypothetical protein
MKKTSTDDERRVQRATWKKCEMQKEKWNEINKGKTQGREKGR